MSISLEKGKKISLEKKSSSGLGEILVNLNWNARPQKQGFLKTLLSGSGAIDLDLGCLFELKNGYKGTVQALGNAFGNLNAEPFIALDGDDRTGASVTGENLMFPCHKDISGTTYTVAPISAISAALRSAFSRSYLRLI